MLAFSSSLYNSTLNKNKLMIKLAFCALCSTLISASMALMLLIARLGLQTPIEAVLFAWTVVPAVSFGLFLYNDPFILPRKDHEIRVTPLLSVAILLFPLSAYLLGGFTRYIIIIFATLGIYNAFKYISLFSKKMLIALGVLSISLSFYLFLYVHNTVILFIHSYLPEHALLGIQIIDTYYHIAITNMIQNFGVVSTGLDGLVPHYYHVGSHIWFAALGKMLGTQALMTYTICHIVICLPLFVLAFGYLSIFIGNLYNIRLPLLLFVASSLFVFINIFPWKIYIYVSESLILALILLSFALIEFFCLPRSGLRAEWRSIILALFFGFLLTMIKIPVGLVWFSFFGYLQLRKFENWTQTILVVGLLLIVMGISIWFYMPPRHSLLQIGTTTSILKNYVDWEGFWESLSFLIMLLFLSLSLIYNRAKYYAEFHGSIFAEFIIIATCVAGWLSVKAYMGIYFFLSVFWISIPIIIIIFSEGLKWLILNTNQIWSRISLDYARVAIVFGFAIFVFSSFFYSYMQNLLPVLSINKVLTQTMNALDQQSNGQLLKGKTPIEYQLATIINEHALFGKDFRKALSETIGAKVITAIKNEQSKNHTKYTAVFMNSINFWKLTEGESFKMSFFVPAVAGIPMLKGLPPPYINYEMKWYGVENYDAEANSILCTERKLIQYAKSKDFEKIIIVPETNEQKNVKSIFVNKI